MKEKKEIMEIVSSMARQAGLVIKERLGGNFSTRCKGSPADFVTDVDRQSQEIILEGLKKYFPEHHVIAEENAFNDFSPENANVWYVDPLDGTTNFVFSIPFYGVSIALAEGGKPSLGIVYDPLRDEMFTAVRNGGAMLNGCRIHADGTVQTLDRSLLVTGFPVSREFKELMADAYTGGILFNSMNIRALGSAALELAYVACGRLTGSWEVKLKPWDVAAGALLVEEAGGMVSGIRGEPLELTEFVDIVSSNGLIHGEFIRALGFGS
ncbi:inositol monophosphatase family protein [Desulfocucumis palustris]|nr:inositol monophosphatase family protein [Desulfocucumis palustris]